MYLCLKEPKLLKEEIDEPTFSEFEPLLEQFLEEICADTPVTGMKLKDLLSECDEVRS
jgi:hypothetical protein